MDAARKLGETGGCNVSKKRAKRPSVVPDNPHPDESKRGFPQPDVVMSRVLYAASQGGMKFFLFCIRLMNLTVVKSRIIACDLFS